MAKTMDEYVTDAKKQLQGTYDNLKTEATNKYNSASNEYNNQYNTTGANFDTQVGKNKENGIMNQNQYNNNTLGRGLGRSSIATTGLAGIQNTTNRIEGDLLKSKESELNKITTLKNQLTESYNSQLLGYDKELESKAHEIAQELKKYDDYLAQKEWERQQALAQAQWEKDKFSQQQQWEKERWEKEQANLAAQQQWEKDKWAQEQELRKQQIAASRARSSRSGGGRSSRKSGGKMESIGSLTARLDGMNPDEANTWVRNNKGAIANTYGYDKYQALQDRTYTKYDKYAQDVSGNQFKYNMDKRFPYHAAQNQKLMSIVRGY